MTATHIKMLCLITLALICNIVVVNSTNVSSSTPIEAYASRTYFYAGGHYENASFGEVMTGQMYVEKLVPQHPTQPYPLLFITGSGQTSTNWLNTPDGREGWGSYFLRLGYTLYLTDQPQRGRSPWVPGEGTISMYNVSFIENFFTAPQVAKIWPQASLHTQWPGTGTKGDPIFDSFFAGEIQQQANDTIAESNNVLAGLALLDEIGEVILVTHSHSGPYGWGIADRRPELVKAVVAIEPEGPPFVQEVIHSGPARPYGVATLPLTYSPPITSASELVTETNAAQGENRSSCIQQVEPARKLVNLEGVPVLLASWGGGGLFESA
ncbi:related to fusarubin cluster-esterase [Phialocephala subalpina]|uniref:Related to fusarubin cluster-esterase n=1 Tax=Phialocephala subalpina TaxID=576137 RepID=A0A1L7XNH6_9HELO|nr:related to fusarubin cluster-esterase [Phialocephala subalpina]